MSFAFGADFRSTPGFVADSTASGGGETIAALVPETGATANYSAGRGYGWEDAPDGLRDRSTSVDPRLAGLHFRNNALSLIRYRIDLPSPGNFRIRCAMGDTVSGVQGEKLELFDDTSSLGVLIDGKTTVGGNHWFDASGIERTSSADWVANNVPVVKTFVSTICRFKIGGQADGAASNSAIVHFYIEAVAVNMVPPPLFDLMVAR